MKLFDLVFIGVFLVTVVMVATIVMNAVMGRGGNAWRYATVLAGMLAVYVTIVVAVGLASSHKVVELQDDLCFDDWCIAVDDVTFARELSGGGKPAQPDGLFYVVRLRISNRSAGREQRERGLSVYLVDDAGRRYEPSERGQRAFEAQHGPVPPFDVTVPWRASVTTVRVFDVAANAREVSLALQHPLGPGLFVIGDSDSLMHKKTLFRLPSPGASGRDDGATR